MMIFHDIFNTCRRGQVMRTLPIPFAPLLVFFLLFHSLAAKQPNVVIVFTDDQGTLDANCSHVHNVPIAATKVEQHDTDWVIAAN